MRLAAASKARNERSTVVPVDDDFEDIVCYLCFGDRMVMCLKCL
jgi:hypothetical protein